MSEKEIADRDQSHRGVRLYLHYGRLLFDQFYGWLGVVLTVLTVIGAIAEWALSFLPNWLDTPTESVPWMLWIGCLIGSYRIYRDQVRSYQGRLADINDKLTRYESAKPDLRVGLVAPTGVVARHGIQIGLIRPLRDFGPVEDGLRDKLMLHHDAMAEKYVRPFGFGYGMGPRPKSEETYKEEVEEYLKAVQAYVNAKRDYAVAKACVRPITVAISNNGTVPVRDVSVEVELPPSVRLATADEVDQYGDDNGDYAPEKPSQPSPTEYFLPFSSYQPQFPQSYNLEPVESNDSRGPRFLARQGRTFIRYAIPSMSAGQVVDDLDPFYLMLDQITQDTELPLHVTICADALRQPMTTTLHFSVGVVAERSQDAA